MKALVKESLGAGHVTLQEVPPPAAGPGQVMIRVEAAGICGSDLHILHGDMKLNLRPPVVMGHEFCGTVAEVGRGVAGRRVGDRVTSETTFRSCGSCLHCRTGNYNLCPGKELIGYVHNGCFAPYCVVPAERVHALPGNISFEEGALCEPLACCVHAVVEKTTVQPGEMVVAAGVGAIGLLCAQVARAAGAHVITCGTRADGRRFAVAKAVGVERTLDVEKQDALEAIRAATGGQGADVFLECSGAPAALMRTIRAGSCKPAASAGITSGYRFAAAAPSLCSAHAPAPRSSNARQCFRPRASSGSGAASPLSCSPRSMAAST
jgi:L-iditol 2-dehydrogenase